MKIKSINHELLFDTDRLTITVPKIDRMTLIHKLEELGTIDESAEYDIKIEKIRKKRSLDANKYMWQLIDKIADRTNETRADVYRHAIRENGVFDDVAVQDRAASTLRKKWETKGLGWFSDEFDSTLPGCKKIRLYYGSSSYDSKEMSRLIDAVVQDAEDLRIETKTPEEIAELKEMWGEE